jgi:hypothetical protein
VLPVLKSARFYIKKKCFEVGALHQRAMQSIRMKWLGYVKWKEEMRNSAEFSSENLKSGDQLGPRRTN